MVMVRVKIFSIYVPITNERLPSIYTGAFTPSNGVVINPTMAQDLGRAIGLLNNLGILALMPTNAGFIKSFFAFALIICLNFFKFSLKLFFKADMFCLKRIKSVLEAISLMAEQN